MKDSSVNQEPQTLKLQTLMKKMADTRVKIEEKCIEQQDSLLCLHISKHPYICWIDLYKFLLQGTCGWRHLLVKQNFESAYKNLTKEFNEIPPLKDEPIFDLLNKETKIGRVHLKTWKYYDLSIDDLWKAMNNVKTSICSLDLFKRGWKELKEYFKTGILVPYIKKDHTQVRLWLDLVEMQAKIALNCDELGLVSHSKLFREKYKPSYRLALETDIEKILQRNGLK